MRPHSAELRDVLRGGAFNSRWVVDVFYDDIRAERDVPVTAVTFNEDGTAKIQQSGTLVIVWQDSYGNSVAPQAVGDLFSPFGTTLRLYKIITLGGLFQERVPMGTFVVSDTPEIDSVRWSFFGRSRVKGEKIKLVFKDPFYKVQRNRFYVPGVTPSLASVYDEIQRLTLLPVTRSTVTDGTIPRALVYDEDRLEAVYELANVLDAVPYMTADGTVSLRPNVWGSAVDTIDAANASEDGRGTLVSASYGMSAEGVYNAVVFRGQGQQAGVLASAQITEGPLRVANANGSDSPFGRVPYFMSSQLVKTPAEAAAIVATWLPRVSRPQATILTITEVENPLREVGDVVTVRRAGQEFPGRVLSVLRTVGKTQTTRVVVANA